MTTFQDPPPQSRRSARQNERGEQQPETPPFVQFSGEQPSFTSAPVQPDATPTSGRRARAAEPEGAAEPLIYSTQGAPTVDFGALPPPAGYTPTPQDPAGYRVRDFSPEGSGRRAAVPPLIEPQQAYAAAPSDLDYRTQAGPPAPAAPAAPVSAPVAAPAPAPAAASDQPPSRREMRQRLAEAEAAAPSAPPASAPVAAAPPPLYQAAPPPQVSTHAPAPAQPVAPPVTMAPPPPVGSPSTMTAPPPERSPSPNALSNAMAEFEALTRTGQTPPPPAPVAQPRAEPTFIEPQLEQTGGWVAPVGHWSRQADLDDETQPWENTITREVGGGNVATTTSALVLPEIPRPTNFSTALDSTGEVLLTGSIDLPHGLSTGGGDPRRYDDSNVDLMYDTRDAEFTGTDSSPVRAIRAVSTHTSSRGVIHANKPRGNRMIVVVFVGTAVLAVTVVGLFIASIVLDVF